MSVKAASDWLTSRTFAHRGLHSAEAVENSRSAIAAAMEVGFGIECDVQMSRDNVPMVFHDWDLGRLTMESGAVAEKSAEALSRIKLGESNDTIWTLVEMLDCVAGRVPILVEIKSRPDFDIQAACAAVNMVVESYAGQIAVMSFDPRMGEWFAQNAPDLRRGLVCTDTLDHGFLHAWRQPQALERAQPDFLAFDIRDLPNAVCGLWREARRPLLTWTVRSVELRDRAAEYADAAIAEGEGIA